MLLEKIALGFLAITLVGALILAIGVCIYAIMQGSIAYIAMGIWGLLLFAALIYLIARGY